MIPTNIINATKFQIDGTPFSAWFLIIKASFCTDSGEHLIQVVATLSARPAVVVLQAAVPCLLCQEAGDQHTE